MDGLCLEVSQFEQLFAEWNDTRQKTRGTLKQLASDMDSYHKNANAVEITGTSVSIAGGVVGVVCLGAAPFTGGLSLLGAAVSAGLTIPGAATSLGAKFTESYLEKRINKDVHEVLAKDREVSQNTNNVVAQLDKINTKLKAAVESALSDFKTSEDESDSEADDSGISEEGDMVIRQKQRLQYERDLADIARVMHIGKGGVALAHIGSKTTAHGARAAAKALGHMTKAVRFGSAAIGAVLLPLDILSFVNTYGDIKKGSIHDASVKMREIVHQLKDEIIQVKDEFRLQGRQLVHNYELLGQFCTHIQGQLNTGKFANIAGQFIVISMDIERLFIGQGLKPPPRVQTSYEAYNILDQSENRVPFLGLSLTVNASEGGDIFEVVYTFERCLRVNNRPPCFVFLQNPRFRKVEEPELGADVFHSSGSSGGISTVFTEWFFHSGGEIVSIHEYRATKTEAEQDTDRSDKDGRCLLINVIYNRVPYTLVNINMSGVDDPGRQLLFNEIANFVESKRLDKRNNLVIGGYFGTQLAFMDIAVSEGTNEDIIDLYQACLPCKEVTDYLLADRDNIESWSTIEDELRVIYQTLCPSEEELQKAKQWIERLQIVANTRDPGPDFETFRSRLRLNDVWCKRNPDKREYTTVRRHGNDCFELTRSENFLLSDNLMANLRSCAIEHSLRVEGLTDQSAMILELE